MESRKRSKGTTGSKERARKAKAHERNGQIEFHGTLSELKAYAASTKFAANRAIVRAAIGSIKALDVDPRMVLCKVTFGLKPVMPLSNATRQSPRARRAAPKR